MPPRSNENSEKKSKELPPDDSLSQRRTLLVQIATQLATSQIALLQAEETSTPLDSPKFDPLFQAALRRADRLITSPTSDETTILAEQLFPANDERLTENQIFEVFKKWKWPQISSRETFLSMMTDVAEWFATRREKLEESISAEYGPSGVQESRFVEAMFRFCGTLTGLPLGGPWPPEIESLADRIRIVFDEHAQTNRAPDHVRMMRARDLAIENELLRLCFGGRTPVQRENETQGMYRSYRPWGLFRYLRFVGKSDPSAASLLEKLRVPRSRLSSDREPFEEVGANTYSNYDLGILEKLAEKIYDAQSADVDSDSEIPPLDQRPLTPD